MRKPRAAQWLSSRVSKGRAGPSAKTFASKYRYAEGDSVRMQALAKELVELKPDCILGHSTPVVTALMHAICLLLFWGKADI